VILVDSSVWVAGFRGDPQIVKELIRLIDDDLAAIAAPIRLELVSGARRGELDRLKRVLGALPTFVPEATTWNRVEKWIEVAAKAGHRFGVMDLLIGSTAKENAASVWSLDDDFQRMAKLRFVKAHRLRQRNS
jgi:predicted nucleic acid-binding protein